jgi:hypothetical protein
VRARHSLIVLVLALAVVPALALDKSDALAEFATNRAKWNAANIQDYEFRLRDKACWCQFGPAYGPIRNIVRSGRIQRAIYEGERRDGYWPGRKVHINVQTKATMEDVFARAARLIQKAPEGTFRVEYDSTYGFPILIDFDDPKWEDEQWRLVIDGFKVSLAGGSEMPNTSLERTLER